MGLTVTFGHASLVSYLVWEGSGPEDLFHAQCDTDSVPPCSWLTQPTFLASCPGWEETDRSGKDWLAHTSPAVHCFLQAIIKRGPRRERLRSCGRDTARERRCQARGSGAQGCYPGLERTLLMSGVVLGSQMIKA